MVPSGAIDIAKRFHRAHMSDNHAWYAVSHAMAIVSQPTPGAEIQLQHVLVTSSSSFSIVIPMKSIRNDLMTSIPALISFI